MIRCEVCKEVITQENFWEHAHYDYESIDWEQHYAETGQK